MTRFTRIAAAAFLAAGFSNLAAAADGPVLQGYGVDTTIVAPNPNGTVFGGALTRVTGSGESAVIEVISAPHAQAPRLARVVGSGVDATLTYAEPAAPAHLAARG